MKGSLIIIGFFAIGVLIGVSKIIPESVFKADIAGYTLLILMLLVGIATGANKKTYEILQKMNFKILLVPFSAILGTWLGIIVLSLFIKQIKFYDLMAIGSGFGYYSLSSVIINDIKGETLGTVALLSNVFRETLTLLFTPLIAKYFGKLSPIASGGATSMDVTLPIITKYVGSEYAIISIFSGTVLTFLVPFLVTFFLKI